MFAIHTLPSPSRLVLGLVVLSVIFFGRYYMPRDQVPEDFGVHEPMPAGYVRQLLHPFKAALGGRRDREIQEVIAP